ncbi:MAG: cysteine--tRNA ligase [Candidatus Fischerbacteria bacterium RBG_13_37_8]|uniref:Cysteine--tRNA ligase n=1 Tax=Candidatus Fischerbacteria bacterium RBG_13_37_8 TaxID=1817863 RepID=A0A1F5VMN5_9BACT|nr:MAG: cysteine--tRNA ligase [Candidatus Fischerbacteria bacterium RBG_13_37_8]
MLYLFNTLTRQKEKFVPLSEGEVKIYTCGPTVYDRVHIGNLRTFMFEDILRRYLQYKGFKVIQTMNITDIDDKTIKGALASGKSLKEYTQHYTQLFFIDIDTLHIEHAEFYPHATDHIDEMIVLIKKLLDHNLAYESKGSIYYRISAFPDYGKLSHLESKELIDGFRIDSDEYEKESMKDFALWKISKEGEPSWETEIGKGRPGWHIECSVMAMKYLGETFDIHAGGVDLIFPHHENEIAQSEGATGKQFVRYWLHSEHLIVDSEKMSKSKGNFYTATDIIEKGTDPLTLRFLLMSVHYRKQLNFTSSSLVQAREAVERLKNFALRLTTEHFREGHSAEKIISLCQNAKLHFEEAMDDDLNISLALASVFELVRHCNIIADANELTKGDATLILNYLAQFDKVFGIIFIEKQEIPEQEILALIEERIQARKDKQYKKADELRDYLLMKGIILEDTKTSTRWKRKLNAELPKEEL